jgi:hypothetical protein
MTFNTGINFSTGAEYNNSGDQYPHFETAVRVHFQTLVAEGHTLFTTDSTGLWDAYLGELPNEASQHYNCRACKNFIERFGGLVTLNEKGEMKSALWDEDNTPFFFKGSVQAMKKIVMRSRVNGVFLSESMNLGQSQTGEWTHLSVQLPKEKVFKSWTETAEQAMAEKKQEFQMVIRAILKFSLDNVNEAIRFFESGSIPRAEKFVGNVVWLKEIHQYRDAVKNSRNRDNIVWLAVALAPTGFTHINGSTVGTVLEDIRDGYSFETIKRRFVDKIDGTKYQRPQTAPSAGNRAQAEKLVQQMGIEKSLERRFARLDEVEAMWKPSAKKNEPVKTTGIFSHLATKEETRKKPSSSLNLPATTMTWRKFTEEVLPKALEIEYYVPYKRDSYSAIVTAEHADAPPILKWDSEEQRNPFSWYLYNQGSHPSDWSLSTNEFHKVNAITLKPSSWFEENAHHGKGIFFILDGARDKRFRGAGNALFPETLRGELHQVRATIEAYSRSATLGGHEESSACGVLKTSDSEWNIKLRVTTDSGVREYKIDRWD